MALRTPRVAFVRIDPAALDRGRAVARTMRSGFIAHQMPSVLARLATIERPRDGQADLAPEPTAKVMPVPRYPSVKR